MKAGSMEGLIGASLNMKLSRTPMRVYKEAELKGDTETMERAMGYAADFQEKAHECSDRAQEELTKELKEERKEQEFKREQAATKRKEEAKEYMEENHSREKLWGSNKSDIQKADSVEISEEGKVLVKSNLDTDTAGAEADMLKSDVKKEPVTYTKTGESVCMNVHKRY